MSAPPPTSHDAPVDPAGPVAPAGHAAPAAPVGPAAPDRVAWFVPGRIEVLGKHTDYAGGRSLLAAVDRGHTVTAVARDEPVVRVTSTIAGERVDIPLAGPPSSAGAPAGHWSGYLRTVVDRLGANFPGMTRGADIVIESDLPLAAGMSSSSALVVGLAMALMELSGITADERFRAEVTDRESLGEYLGTVENGQSYGSLAGHRGVGTFGGSEDHTAMLCGREGALVQYAFCPVRLEQEVAFPEDAALVVGVSGVQAEKTGAARDRYNGVSQAAAEVLRRWNARTGRADRALGDAVRSDANAPGELRALVADDGRLSARLDQFLRESEEIIPAAAGALGRGDLEAFGDLVDDSQRLAERGLANQTPETIGLQSLARRMGARAASAFGAGFGGSVWAMVPRADADEFARAWLDAYEGAFPAYGGAATWLVTRPGAPAHRV